MAYDAKQIAKAAGGLTLAGAPEGFDALVMADIARARGGLTAFVARDTARANAFIDALKFFAPEIEAVLFPSWDCLPYDRIGPSAGVAATRMATLSRLARGLGRPSRPCWSSPRQPCCSACPTRRC
jgi:transcription-repair coupling factor (superfamily II helicase)